MSIAQDSNRLELKAGQRLSRAEFERRYLAAPESLRAELIEGVVHVASPVRYLSHGEPTLIVAVWLNYALQTPGVLAGSNSTVRLDGVNECQPDGFLFFEAGGGARIDADDYISGAPEFIAEVAASTASVELHEKFNAYQRNGVREYLVWRPPEHALDWFVLHEGQYVAAAPTDNGVIRSQTFPGLWLNVAALLELDGANVLQTLQAGLASSEHREFLQG